MLVLQVNLKLREDDIDIIVDPALEGTYPREIFHGMTDLAIRCSAFESNERPAMKVELSMRSSQQLTYCLQIFSSHIFLVPVLGL